MGNIYKTTYKSGKVAYHVKIRLKGSPRQSATFQKITDAKRWIQITEAAIKEGRYFKQVPKRTLSELIDRYIENVIPYKGSQAKIQTQQLNWWKRELGDKLLSDVTSSAIAKTKDLLMKQSVNGKKRSNATCVRYLMALSHAFTIAIKEWEWIQDNPVSRVMKPQEPRGRVRVLNDEERKRLLDVCKESSEKMLYPLVVIALSTGMRISEIKNLKWKDIDFDKGRAVIHESKNGQRRGIPLVGYALDLIKNIYLQKHNNAELVFASSRKKYTNRPLHFFHQWRSAVNKASIEDFRFHDLRHCCASYLAMNGASIAEIAEVLGHKTLAMVKRYLHISESHTSKVVSRMNNEIFPENLIA